MSCCLCNIGVKSGNIYADSKKAFSIVNPVLEDHNHQRRFTGGTRRIGTGAAAFSKIDSG
jgi:hypothetical protein